MSDIAPQVLADALSLRLLQYRTGLLFLPLASVGDEPEIAARLGISHCDLLKKMLGSFAPDSRQLGLRREWFASQLLSIARETSLNSSCVLLSNTDIMIAAFNYEDRLRFWRHLRENFRAPCGMLVSVPIDANNLLPSDERSRWILIDRASTWNKG